MRVDDHINIRYIMMDHFEKGWTPGLSFRYLTDTYGDETISKSSVEKWFARFKSGDRDVEDKEGRGRQSDFNDKALLEAVEQDKSLTSRALAEQFGVGQSTIVRHLQKLGKIKSTKMAAENGSPKGTAAPEPASAVTTEVIKSPMGKRLHSKPATAGPASKIAKKEVNARIRHALKRGVSTGELMQTKGVGASDSFRIGDNKTTSNAVTKPKSSPKKAVKSSVKKVASKPAAAPVATTAAKSKKAVPKKMADAAKPTSTMPANKPAASKNRAATNKATPPVAAPAATTSSTAIPKKAVVAAAPANNSPLIKKKKPAAKMAPVVVKVAVKGSPIVKKKAAGSKKKSGKA